MILKNAFFRSAKNTPVYKTIDFFSLLFKVLNVLSVIGIQFEIVNKQNAIGVNTYLSFQPVYPGPSLKTQEF